MKAHARVILPNRTQMEFRASDLESLLAEGHRARLVWSYVVGQDLGRFYERIRVREGGVGRAAIAPEPCSDRNRGLNVGNTEERSEKTERASTFMLNRSSGRSAVTNPLAPSSAGVTEKFTSSEALA